MTLEWQLWSRPSEFPKDFPILCNCPYRKSRIPFRGIGKSWLILTMMIQPYLIWTRPARARVNVWARHHYVLTRLLSTKAPSIVLWAVLMLQKLRSRNISLVFPPERQGQYRQVLPIFSLEFSSRLTEWTEESKKYPRMGPMLEDKTNFSYERADKSCLQGRCLCWLRISFRNQIFWPWNKWQFLVCLAGRKKPPYPELEISRPSSLCKFM